MENTGVAINRQTFKQKMQSYLKHPGSMIVCFLTILAAAITTLVFVYLIAYILIKGIPFLTPDLFQWEYNSENVSMLPSIINTLLLTALALIIAVPLGIFAAIYMVEYAKKGNRLVKIVRITAETLSGIPSIVYGLFGMLCFVTMLKMRLSLLSGALTVAIMVLPTIMRTTEEALLAVPYKYREGSFGLGAGRLRTVFRIVLPAAVPGILSGVILATGRIVGETAALIYTAGTMAEVPSNIFSSARTLSVHMYLLSKEGLNTNQAFATAVVLMIMVIFINMLSNFLGKKLAAKEAD
ncbi:MAG: phosphate ABC transporter permease PstA [Butyribacter sp.]|nr:phosphate ABC transporter permease PstA [bacterium]MDY3854916.1 phosphate ABC transporter permease PstA [Butyribacter sp.]